MYKIEQTKINKEYIKKYSNLLSLCFPKDNRFTIEYLTWQYCQNPAGHILGFNAFYGSELAAHYVTMPILANLKGTKTKGLLSLNTATHPKHRGKGLFPKLAKETYKLASDMGYAFIIGVANKYSTPGFINKLDFKLIKPLDVKLFMGNPPCSKQNNLKLDFQRIWNDELLNWRLNRPFFNYKYKKHLNYINYYAPSGYIGINAFLLTSSTKIKHINKIAKSPLYLYLGINSYLNWNQLLSLSVPLFLRPSPLNLIFKGLQKETLSLNLNSNNIEFNALDFDAY